MPTQCGSTRRSVLGALAGMVVGAMTPGARRALAVKDDGARPRPDYASKEAFELECELLGGTFSEDGMGNTNCDYPGGGNVQCDANGKDCWHTPASGPRPRPPLGGGDQIDGPQDKLPTDDPPSEEPSNAPESPETTRPRHGKGQGKSKRGTRRRGKRRA